MRHPNAASRFAGIADTKEGRDVLAWVDPHQNSDRDFVAFGALLAGRGCAQWGASAAARAAAQIEPLAACSVRYRARLAIKLARPSSLY
jgi:hypothetical protein